MTKTYTTTIEKPRLVIEYDSDAESPREWDNLGHFVTRESKYISPDGNTSAYYHAMIDTANEASNTADHIRLMEIALKERGKKVYKIYPVTRYEHGNVSYRLGTAKGFDYSACGFYIVTDKENDDIKLIGNELEVYSKYCNGEVYGFTLYDENGEIEESCSGLYDIEDVREYLPKEWKGEKMSDYLK